MHFFLVSIAHERKIVNFKGVFIFTISLKTRLSVSLFLFGTIVAENMVRLPKAGFPLANIFARIDFFLLSQPN